jgi:hypothetical protein
VSTVPARCIACGGQGPIASTDGKPAWCTCTGKKRGGPYQPPPGVVIRYTVESRDAAAFRERCRQLGNAERRARDDLAGRFVRAGTGYRELPRTSPKRRALEAAYRTARRALEAVQAVCSHPERSIHAPDFCSVCYAQAQTDIAGHRAWQELSRSVKAG